MEKDRIVGVLRQARGIRKNKAGDKIADAKPSARDKAEKIAGKGQTALGAEHFGTGEGCFARVREGGRSALKRGGPRLKASGGHPATLRSRAFRKNR